MRKGAVGGRNAAAFEQISAEEQRLELERTREELLRVKRDLAERDAEITQLKTNHRKLQDVLRKKDKDLQSIFAVLRSPQEGEVTKKRKTELVERLLMETQQRVANAEAVADERKRELDRMKFSSKFLRHQELEVEIEESHAEIERLRYQLNQFTIVGKLKVTRGGSSATPGKRRLSPTATEGRRQEPAPPPLRHVVAHTNQEVVPIIPSAMGVESMRRREKFVEKTRRRAVEAEYQKQMRLAELEAQCELEENLRVRMKREAQLQAERRHKSRQDRPPTVGVVAAPVQTKPHPPTAVDTPGLDGPPVASAVVVAFLPPLDEPPEAAAAVVDMNGSACLIQSAWRARRERVAEETEDSRGTNIEPEPSVPVTATLGKQYDDEPFDDGEDDEVIDEKPATAGEEKGTEVDASEESAAEEEIDDDNLDEEAKPTASTVAEKAEESVIDEEEACERDVQSTTVAEVTLQPVEDVATNSDDPPREYHQGWAVDPKPQQHQQQQLVESHDTERQDDCAEQDNHKDMVAPAIATSNRQGWQVDPEPADPMPFDSPSPVTQPDEPTQAIALVPVAEPTPVDQEDTIQAIALDPVAEPTPVDQAIVPQPEDTHSVAAPECEGAFVPEAINSSAASATSSSEEMPDEEAADPTEDKPTIDPVASETVDDYPSLPSLVQHTEAIESDEEPVAAPLSEPEAKPNQLDEHAASAASTVATITDAQPAIELAEQLETAIEDTIDKCDEAIAASTTFIQNQIDTAISTPLGTTATAVTDIKEGSFFELTASELAAAMDAAARKIQKFWREMEAKFGGGAKSTEPLESARSASSSESKNSSESALEVQSSHDTSGATSPVVSEHDPSEEDEW